MLSEEINDKLFEHVMAGIEVISGKHGHFYAQNVFNYYDKKFLKKWFCVKDYDQKMKKIYEEISLSDHFLHLYGPSIVSNDAINNNLLKKSEKKFSTVVIENGVKGHEVNFLKRNSCELERCNSLPLKKDNTSVKNLRMLTPRVSENI